MTARSAIPFAVHFPRVFELLTTRPHPFRPSLRFRCASFKPPAAKNRRNGEIFPAVLRLSPTATHGDVCEADRHCRLHEIGDWLRAQSVIRCDHLDSGHRAISFADFGQCAAPRDAGKKLAASAFQRRTTDEESLDVCNGPGP